MMDMITITGNVATDPASGQTATGIPVTNFRVASTYRRFDSATQTWVDAGTNWYSIAAYRRLANHAKASLRIGDSVIIRGRLKIRTWENNGKQGTSVDIDAETIGHDLRWGTAAFAKAARASQPEIMGQAPESAEEQIPELTAEEKEALNDAVWTAPDAPEGTGAELAEAGTRPF